MSSGIHRRIHSIQSIQKQMPNLEYTIHHNDCVKQMASMETDSIDAAILSPPYPGIKRSYGTWKPSEWLPWMQEVMKELRRIVKPQGSAIVVIEPNFERIGKRNTWAWEFALNMAKLWNIVQDAYWIKPTRFPTSAATIHGLMRTAVEWCLWLGNPDCYRNQKAVLWEYSESQLKEIARRSHMSDDIIRSPCGGTKRRKRMAKDNGGATPMNFLLCATQGYKKHPACFPVKLAEHWVKYICPQDGLIIDPFCGSGTTGVACIRHSRRFCGIDNVKEYVTMANERIQDEINNRCTPENN